MFGYLILFGNIFAETFNSLMQRYFAKTFSEQKISAYLLVNLLFFYPIGLIYSFINRSKVNFGPIIREQWMLLLLIGLTAGVTYRFVMVVNHKVEASTQQIVGSLRIVGTLLLAAFFLSEKLSNRQYVGAAILILASLLYLHTKQLTKNKPYIILLVLITLLFCVFLVAEKFLINKYGLPSYLPIGWGLEVFFFLLLSGKLAIKELKQTRYSRKAKQAFIIMGIFDAAASLTYVLSVNAWQSVSLVNVTRVFQLPLAVFLAIFLLKEKDLLGRKVLAVALAAVGLWLVL